jgi:hypothetical protein
MAAVAQAPCLMDPANQSMSQRMKWKGVRLLKADGSEAPWRFTRLTPGCAEGHAEPAAAHHAARQGPLPVVGGVPGDQRRGKDQRGIELQGVRGQWVAAFFRVANPC